MLSKKSSWVFSLISVFICGFIQIIAGYFFSKFRTISLCILKEECFTGASFGNFAEVSSVQSGELPSFYSSCNIYSVWSTCYFGYHFSYFNLRGILYGIPVHFCLFIFNKSRIHIIVLWRLCFSCALIPEAINNNRIAGIKNLTDFIQMLFNCYMIISWLTIGNVTDLIVKIIVVELI